MTYSLEAIKAQADALRDEKAGKERPTSRFSSVSLSDQRIVAMNQWRAQKWFDDNIAPLQEMLAEMEAEDINVLLFQETGAPEGAEIAKTHNQNKIDIKTVLYSKFAELSVKRRQYLKEGMSTPTYKAAFGAICGRLEALPGVKLDAARRLDFKTVTTAHYAQVVKIIQAEIDDQNEVEAEKEPGESPDYTHAIDSQDDLKAARQVGDASEPDTDDLLREEFAKRDELDRRLSMSA